MTDEYQEAFISGMHACRDLVEDYLPEDPDGFEHEFWRLVVSYER